MRRKELVYGLLFIFLGFALYLSFANILTTVLMVFLIIVGAIVIVFGSKKEEDFH